MRAVSKLAGAALFGLAFAGLYFTRKDDQMDPSERPEPIDSDEDRVRERIVEVARGEVGEQDPNKYWAETAPSLVGTSAAWCGGFALWALHEAGVGTDIPWVVGKGFCFRLPQTQRPKPGDIAYFDRFQHHAIVVKVEDGMLHTIDGNQPPGESVAERTRPVGDARAFFDVGPMIRGEGLVA